MSFHLEMPDLSNVDLWKDADFTVASEGTSDIISVGKVPYIAYVTESNGSYKINIKKYVDGKWIAVGNSISCSINPNTIKLFMVGSELNVAFNDYNDVPIYKLSGTSWQKVSSINTYSDFGFANAGSKVYISYINEGGKVVLASYDGTKTTIVKSTSESSLMYGNPKVCVFNNIPYISCRNAVGNIIVIYKYENGSLNKVSNDMIIGKAYDMKVMGGNMYVTATDESNHMALYKYNGLVWTKEKTTDNNADDPKMLVSNGNLYYVYSSNTADGNTTIYRYDTKINDFVAEGECVDGYSRNQSMVDIGGEMYVSYTINGQIKVKHKALQVINFHEHKWNDKYTVDKKPTCVKAGSKTIHCAECEAVKNRQVIPALGHYYVHKKIPAKIGIYGKEYYECARCKNKKNVKLIAPLRPSTTTIRSFTRARRAFTVRWTKKSYSGYQIRYSLKSSMASSKVVTVANASTVSKKVTGLKSRKRYYVQIRTYKVVNGRKYYSVWSTRKSVRVR